MRLEAIVEYMTSFVYRNVCRGLFSRHEILFIFNICLQIYRQNKVISNAKYFTFLRGAGMEVNPSPNPMPDSLSEAGWNLLLVMDMNIPDFDGILKDVTKNSKTWEAWA